jgi:pilus assembly protein CpaC
VQGGGGNNAVSISFKEYGIRLNFLPTITPRGSIHLQLAAEVSALDFADAITVSGYTEPALTVRRVKDEVELSDRQSFAVGGLLNNTENETYEKIPFLGDIPILGKFFQSMKRVKSNTELIVIVTPVIVDPVPAGTEIALPKTPQPFLPPNSNTPMHTPENAQGDATPAPAAMPLEKLIESMKPGPQLSDPSSGSMGSSGGGGGASAGTP